MYFLGHVHWWNRSTTHRCTTRLYSTRCTRSSQSCTRNVRTQIRHVWRQRLPYWRQYLFTFIAHVTRTVKVCLFMFRLELLIFWSSYQATLAEVLKTMTSRGLTSDCFELNSSKVNFLTSNLLMTTSCSKWKLKMYNRLKNYIFHEVFHVVTSFMIRVWLI